MRKMLSSVACLLLATGLVVAAEVIFVSYDPKTKELKVKEGDKEAAYQVTDRTKVTLNDKDGDLRVLERMKAGRTKFDLTAEKGEATAIKVTFQKKGK